MNRSSFINRIQRRYK